MNLDKFLKEDKYVDYSSDIIQKKSHELFKNINDDIKKAKIAFEYVCDEVKHSFDINADIVTSKASDVLKYKTGICFAKSNLLAALLRSQGIPVRFCIQHLTLLDDDTKGYCIHCYNAIYLNNKWIKVDARGNKKGIDAQFSLDEPKLAFKNRPQYDEYFINGIFADANKEVMEMLDNAVNIKYVAENLQDYVSEKPDLLYEI